MPLVPSACQLAVLTADSKPQYLLAGKSFTVHNVVRRCTTAKQADGQLTGSHAPITLSVNCMSLPQPSAIFDLLLEKLQAATGQQVSSEAGVCVRPQVAHTNMCSQLSSKPLPCMQKIKGGSLSKVAMLWTACWPWHSWFHTLPLTKSFNPACSWLQVQLRKG